MSTVETVRVKADNAKGFRVINRSAFDPKEHKLAGGDTLAPLSDDEQKMADEDAARRKVDANRGQSSGAGGIVTDRNPSGTYSEPTPSDIRYPNKLETEFENNLGAFVGKSAAGLRAEQGLEDKPGGLNPEKKEAEDAKVAAARAENKRFRDGEVAEKKSAAGENGVDFDSMTVPELRDYADSHDIDLGDATLKADLLKKVKKASRD